MKIQPIKEILNITFLLMAVVQISIEMNLQKTLIISHQQLMLQISLINGGKKEKHFGDLIHRSYLLMEESGYQKVKEPFQSFLWFTETIRWNIYQPVAMII